MTDFDPINWFRAAAAYINAHRGKTFVVYLEDDQDNESVLQRLVLDLNLLHSLGVRIVLVPGARCHIDCLLQSNRLETSFHLGRRVSSAEAMRHITAAASTLGAHVEALFTLGLSGSPMHLADVRVVRGNFVVARPLGVVDGVDYQYSGAVRRVRRDAIDEQLKLGNLVLLSNLGYSLTGETFNLSALEVATEVAIELAADKLILLSSSGGIYDAKGTLVASLNRESAARQLATLQESAADGTGQGSLLEAAIRAQSGGVARVHLISSREHNALLQELFTRQGRGTLLSQDSLDSMRPAVDADIAGIMALIQHLEAQGILVPRSRERLEDEIANFVVIELEQTLIACGALYPIDADSAEVACIAIHPDYRKKGLGDRLLDALHQRAIDSGYRQLYVLTTATAHWFIEREFVEVALEDLPEPRRSLYNYQRNSKVLRKALAN
jgi:amino-acid N-acetyltransferase